MRLDKEDHRLLVLWTADCAEHVLRCFEEKYPKDDRPRKAVEAGRAWARGDMALSEARAAALAAHAAARDVDQAAARAAARAAGHAVATAHVVGHAAHAATYAVTAATCAAGPTDAVTAAAKEREWQYRHLPKHLRPVAVSARGNDESLEERIRRVTSEPVEIVGYDPSWPASFEREKRHLLECLPEGIVLRIEHFGSTAVPGLSAKPMIDMLVEVVDLRVVRERAVPVLESQGYEYFWRPTFGDDGGPFYAWFIKRDPQTGKRSHHIHMVEGDFAAHWDRLLFRDYLIEHPDVAAQYETLKRALATGTSADRVRYTDAKSDFISRVTDDARRASRT